MNDVSLLTIYIPNILAILLITTALISNFRYFKEKGAESKLLLFMFVLVFVSCFSDPITRTVNGMPGYISRIFIFSGHIWTYLANILMSYCWLLLLLRHMGIKLVKLHEIALFITVCAEVIILSLNIFFPIVFNIDENNFYQRGPLYAVYYLISAFILLDSVIVYFVVKRKCGPLRTYPIWVYIVAFPVGLVLQIMFLGISISWACDAVALTGILCTLHDEMFYRDKVTDLYNRTYFENVVVEIIKNSKPSYTVIRTSIKDIKNIVRDFGDYEGDDALKEIGSMLNIAVGRMGVVTRYDDNEFISIVNTLEDDKIEQVLNSINNMIAEYNSQETALYKLNATVKYAKLDGARDALDTVFDDECFSKYDLTNDLEVDDKVRGLSVKRSSIIFVILEELFVLFTILCSVSTSEKYERLTLLNDEYTRLQNNVYTVQEVSDYLSNRSRQFVITQNVKYAREYYEEINESKRLDKAAADINEILHSLNAAGNSFMDDAISKSINLSNTETHAMALVYSTMPTDSTIPAEIVKFVIPKSELQLLPEDRKLLALSMLLDENYTDEKELILSSVKYASSYILDTINMEMNECTREYKRDSTALKIFVALCAFAYLISIASLIALVLVPLESSIKSIEREKPIKYGWGYELNFLAHSINKLRERNIETKLHLRDTAEKDALTGILNRKGFEGVKNYYTDSDDEIACIIIDVDYFKEINDTYGHEEGDKALVRIASLLKDMFRETDYVVRYGGDEFLVIMSGTGISSKGIVSQKLEAINRILTSEYIDGKFKLSVSIGCAFSENGYNDLLFERADAALYKTKQKGRCGYTIFE